MDSYAIKFRDLNVLSDSASGGAFYAIAKKVIEAGGCVFGCSLINEDLVARHIMIETIAELKLLQGAKYVESELGRTFSQCADQLKKGRKVLFSGTPCQILFLRDYIYRVVCDKTIIHNLVLVDIICHGVPMKEVFNVYKKELEHGLGGKLNTFSFRKKMGSWRHGRLIASSSGRDLNIPYGESAYIKAFLKGLSLTPKCYACAVKGENRASDITIGDCWGIEFLNRRFDNDQGVSLVVLHSEIGHKYFNMIQDLVEFVDVNYKDALKYNESYFRPTKKHFRRNFFLKHYKVERFSDVVSACIKQPWWYRSFLRRVIKI